VPDGVQLSGVGQVRFVLPDGGCALSGLRDRSYRIRDVRVGPDGYLYVLTDESNGELWKVSPAS